MKKSRIVASATVVVFSVWLVASGVVYSFPIPHGRPSEQDMVALVRAELDKYERIMETGMPEPVMAYAVNREQRERYLATLVDDPEYPAFKSEHKVLGERVTYVSWWRHQMRYGNRLDLSLTIRNVDQAKSPFVPAIFFDLEVLWPTSDSRDVVLETARAKAEFWVKDGAWRVKIIDTPNAYSSSTMTELVDGCNNKTDACKKDYWMTLESEHDRFRRWWIQFQDQFA